ncbi:MAG: hypothetical protein H6601_06550 [Flavobacteriales bacterium]|nr:hypothetical protein [Flavobacteriales bacterium]
MRIALALSGLLFLNSCAYYFGNSWQNSFKKIEKTNYPAHGNRPERVSDEALQTHPLVLEFASKDVVRPQKKDQRGPERLLIAKLVAGRDIDFVNNYLLESVPWGNSGTSGALNPKGDYDFTTVILASILHRFAEDSTILWNRTEEHLAHVLLVEEGGRPHKKTPRTMKIMKDTENHILMTNISQYLKNQWMWAHAETDAKYNNATNGLEQFLIDNLEELHTTGQYEFNSKPYEGYTISALLILYSYADSEAIKKKTQEVLDDWAWEYMQTSSHFRKSAPFRRRMERFKSTSLTDNASTSMMKAWWLEKNQGSFEPKDIAHNHHQAMSAVIYDYRPPMDVWEVDNSERLLLIGHGKGSSPEIHSRGNGFLLSAGGFQRGEASQIVARPIVLMLDDDAVDLNDCFHINGSGKWQKWNNTGVHHRFAVARSAVQVPSRYEATDSLGNWKLFQPNNDVTVVTYSDPDFGLIYLPEGDVNLQQLTAENPDPTAGSFKNGSVSIVYDVRAPKGKWVITQANGQPTDRRTDSWKRVRMFAQ